VMYDAPSLCLGVPIRYAHSHASLMYLQDYEHTLSLLLNVIQRLDDRALATIRSR
jgi:putative aminopeptidase FrvX